MGSCTIKAFMPAVAPQAEKGLVLFQEIVGNGAVRIMAEGAILLDRGMLIEKGHLLVGMALIAEVIDRNRVKAVFPRPMSAVAAAALHPTLTHRVMGGKFRQHFHLLVAVIAERRFALV